MGKRVGVSEVVGRGENGLTGERNRIPGWQLTLTTALFQKWFADSDARTQTAAWMRCGIGLGSNIENRLAHLRAGCEQTRLLNEAGPPIRASSIYETAPVDCEPGTMSYFNAVMEINFRGPPVALLDRLLEIEKAMGRPSKRPRNSPRIIDLDVLYAGNLVLNNPEIIIPHPRMNRRRFVLTPLAEISPDLVLPGQMRSVRSILKNLDDPAQVIRLGIPLFSRE